MNPLRCCTSRYVGWCADGGGAAGGATSGPGAAAEEEYGLGVATAEA